MRQPTWLVVAVLALACGSQTSTSNDDGGAAGPPPWLQLTGDRLAPLPPQGIGSSTHFVTADACTPCHTGGDPKVLRDAKGRDISPGTLWRASMMAHAVRDPYYLATFSQELAHRPAATAAIESTCIPCHAPAAAYDLALEGTRLHFSDLVTGSDKPKELARDGVNCSLCHQITSTGLGSFGSFDGKFSIGDQKLIYGPLPTPYTTPMQTFVGYTPTEGKHVLESSLCATCHTVITKALDAKGNAVGPDFVEQGAYLEWRASDFTTEGGKGGPKATSCQSCHVPPRDEEGGIIDAILSRQPATGLPSRSPLARHLFVGGNSQMLRVLADNGAWTGSLATKEALEAQAVRSDDTLRGGVSLTISRTARVGGGVEVDVTVDNKTGHKFPTGYPSRRAWLHLRSTSGTSVVFESGRVDAYGRVVDAQGNAIDQREHVRPHRDYVDSDAQAQIYELVPGDSQGRVARSLLDATQVLKDDRLLPSGFSKVLGALVLPVGTDGDANFGSSDRVTYRFAASGKVHVDVELLFQSVRPSELETLALEPTPAGRSFLDMIQKRATPVVLGSASSDLN